MPCWIDLGNHNHFHSFQDKQRLQHLFHTRIEYLLQKSLCSAKKNKTNKHKTNQTVSVCDSCRIKNDLRCSQGVSRACMSAAGWRRAEHLCSFSSRIGQINPPLFNAAVEKHDSSAEKLQTAAGLKVQRGLIPWKQDCIYRPGDYIQDDIITGY